MRLQPTAGTWVQAGELAALLGVLAEVLAALRPLAQRRHAHLRLAVVTRAAQTRVVALWREVVALVHHVVLDVHARLPCGEKQQQSGLCVRVWSVLGGAVGIARTSLAEEGELLVAVLGVPAVQPSLVHALDLEALQLGAEDVVLAGRRLPQVGETLRGQEDLHGA